ncbi:MAG TPA: VCBS repeat-containing protein [Kofleriaceae bacterium]|nr:VCBS repeat-containing protein [Kofleriaceae bacterium]
MVAACKGAHGGMPDAGGPGGDAAIDGAIDGAPDAPPDAGSVCHVGLTQLPWIHADHTPASAAVADLDRDGIPDLVIGTQGDATVHVWLGTGGGRFRPGASYAMHGGAAGAVGLVLADLDHDGKLDLVVASSDLIVQRGNGDGTFGAPIAQPVGGAAGAVTVDDLDGDGKLDAVVVLGATAQLGVLRGHGDGTFATAVTYAATPNPTRARIADVTGDGKPDLVVGSVFRGLVGVLIGNGDGTFQPRVDHELPQVASAIAVGDRDHDGAFDVVAVANTNLGELGPNASTLFGQRDGLGRELDFEVSPAAVAVELADVDGDGQLNVVTTHDLTGTVEVVLNTFPASRAQVGGFPATSVLADLDGDGKLDLVTPNTLSDNVSIELGAGDGSFRDTPRGGPAAFYLLADLDGDGKLDAVGPRPTFFAPEARRVVTVQLGTGGGVFHAPVDVAVASPPIAAVTGDLDHDGKLDLVVLTDSATESVLRGNGDGTFQPRIDLAAPGVTAIAIADLDGDHKADLIESHAGDAPFLRVQLGDGDGHFHAGGDIALPGAAGPLAIGDLDGDGVADLAVAAGETVRVLLGNGDGTFRGKLDLPVAIAPLSIDAVDVSGDGKRDLVIAGGTDAGGNLVRVMLGAGDGTFTTQGDTAVPFASGATVGDVTGDGAPDVVIYGFEAHTLALLVGRGDGTLAPAVEYGAASDLPATVVIADVTGDGRPDIVVSGGSLFAPACVP